MNSDLVDIINLTLAENGVLVDDTKDAWSRSSRRYADLVDEDDYFDSLRSCSTHASSLVCSISSESDLEEYVASRASEKLNIIEAYDMQGSGKRGYEINQNVPRGVPTDVLKLALRDPDTYSRDSTSQQISLSRNRSEYSQTKMSETDLSMQAISISRVASTSRIASQTEIVSDQDYKNDYTQQDKLTQESRSILLDEQTKDKHGVFYVVHKLFHEINENCSSVADIIKTSQTKMETIVTVLEYLVCVIDLSDRALASLLVMILTKLQGETSVVSRMVTLAKGGYTMIINKLRDDIQRVKQ